ncbi:MAG: hypothetical protein QNI84_11830 [Henriciella sp.]|nr:hypothetical protein [Henriciella sp.]
MSVVQKIPAAYEEAESTGKPPIVTLIGSDLPEAYLDEAEPSPLMETLGRIWRRIVGAAKLLIVLVLVGGYPAAVMTSHQVDDSQIVMAPGDNWTSPEIGTALTLVGRELTGAGIAADRGDWHPQARLIALPAWQDSTFAALSEYVLASANATLDADGRPDVDLTAAGRLLAPADDTKLEPRLHAAAEALQRFDGRVSRELTIAPVGLETLFGRLDMFASWASEAQTELRVRANSAEAWPASKQDVMAIYQARARAHVAGQLLMATFLNEPSLVSSPDAAEAMDRAFATLRRAATFSPMIISSQSGTGKVLSDHPATMTFYMLEAETALMDLKAALEAQAANTEAVTVASAEETVTP